MLRRYILILYFSSTSLLLSQSIIDSRSNSLAQSNISDKNPISSLFNNPCGTLNQKNDILILGYSNYLQISELGRMSIGYIKSTNRNIIFGATVQRFGYSLYNENKISALSSKKLFDWMDIGIRINYLHNRIYEINKNENYLTFDFGTSFKIDNKFSFSIFLENFTNNLLHKNNSNNTNFRLGLRNEPIEKLILFFEYQHYLSFENDIKLGVEYLLNEKINFQTGLSLTQKYFGIGGGFYYKDFSFNLGIVVSPILNLNTSSLLSYEFK